MNGGPPPFSLAGNQRSDGQGDESEHDEGDGLVDRGHLERAERLEEYEIECSGGDHSDSEPDGAATDQGSQHAGNDQYQRGRRRCHVIPERQQNRGDDDNQG